MLVICHLELLERFLQILLLTTQVVTSVTVNFFLIIAIVILHSYALKLVAYKDGFLPYTCDSWATNDYME